ncbi:hypothetical protein H257_10812 [Aphanomyces astaci]|uniref:Uncharacterized protein n=1 Tax=Aphanomyces astaci TaxID=112090 RepID=W4G5Y1_APHAT|nr:hypothetical protein H257_10812 [Aphanomyces astaci]ETV74696.1 hypothetical protein H257_10812 [Aphanomyces astaci]|eukprot:XP_009835783.1 hypothetical protein H257_10812 [Aphanomyces astaci]
MFVTETSGGLPKLPQSAFSDVFLFNPTRDVQYARVLAKAEKALSLALKAMPDAAICWPTFDQQVVWAQATEAREPLVTGVFAFVDGKNLPVREPSSSDLQNAHHQGKCNFVFIRHLAPRHLVPIVPFGLDDNLHNTLESLAVTLATPLAAFVACPRLKIRQPVVGLTPYVEQTASMVSRLSLPFMDFSSRS